MRRVGAGESCRCCAVAELASKTKSRKPIRDGHITLSMAKRVAETPLGVPQIVQKVRLRLGACALPGIPVAAPMP